MTTADANREFNFRGALPYDWDDGVKHMLDLARELERSGCHHLPGHAAAMRLALHDANLAYSYNKISGVLVALGAFWNIFCGRLEEEPKYMNRESVIAARNAEISAHKAA